MRTHRMFPFLLRSAFLLCTALLLLASTAQAQEEEAQEAQVSSAQPVSTHRASESIYFKGRLGLNTYGGDRDVNPQNEVQKHVEKIGFSLGLEVGYHFSPWFSLGVMHLSGEYPRVNTNRPEYPDDFPTIDPDRSSKWRHHFSLIARSHILPEKRVSPYGQLGLNVSLGKINDESRTGVGPTMSFGLDAAVTDRMGIFLELTGILTFPDDAMDLAAPESRRNVNNFDAFTFVGFGARFTLKSSFVDVAAVCHSVPLTLVPGQSGDFTARLANEDATRPIEFIWDFGDGNTAPGLVASHSYSEPGTYQVRFTASNRKLNRQSTDTVDCPPVTVLAPPTLVTLTAPLMVVDTCEPIAPVTFNANVQGSGPFTYEWDFGDGNTSTDSNPSHTYSEPGSYVVTLRTTNNAGTDTRSLTITVNPCEVDYCVEVTEMNSVFFDRNSSVLTAQARESLEENLQILRDCPHICALVEGYSSRDERNPEQLSADRARAVEKFYLDGGIDPTRVFPEGLGAAGQTTKKGGASQFRRADTTPRPCTELQNQNNN